MDKVKINVNVLIPTMDVEKYGYLRNELEGETESEEGLQNIIKDFLSDPAWGKITITKSKYVDEFEDAIDLEEC